ncbi:hypothetical protein EX30DRAFT_338786 [Ascodesmis nigricans]|uniref:Uncharacterized protein n=1 Tax=Ascodesmis nigricans TaxID=341454 RepID=A0A4S2N523_9PEZI|nr:hypothetical protein EX30DRAFT_338786 [Ascodesmis nigricans]
MRPFLFLPRPRLFTVQRSPQTFLRRSSTKPPSPSAPPTPTQSRISRLPARLQPYAQRFKDQPASHITAFLVLHEVTAIVPLLGLVGLFRVTDYSPTKLVKNEWLEGSLGFWERWVSFVGIQKKKTKREK